MSEYFSDKDDQSFDMPNDDPSAPSGATPPPVPPTTGGAPDESGFGNTSPGSNPQQQDAVYFGILAVIIAVMLYTLYAMFFASSPVSAEKIQPVPVEAPAKQAVAPPQPSAELPRFGQNRQPTSPTSASSTSNTSMDMAAQAVPKPQATSPATSATSPQQATISSTKLNEVVEENSVLSAAVRRLTDNKEKSDQRMTDLESEVDELVATIDETKAQLAALKKQIAEQNSPKQPKKELTYNIQAVVEGRAWLQSNGGANITVKVGDELKGYGVVTKIDAVNSVIQTSSGKRIRVN